MENLIRYESDTDILIHDDTAWDGKSAELKITKYFKYGRAVCINLSAPETGILYKKLKEIYDTTS